MQIEEFRNLPPDPDDPSRPEEIKSGEIQAIKVFGTQGFHIVLEIV
jgi:hypothetical protein